MKLYVCYGTFKSRKPGGHPCRSAYLALTEAGCKPEIVRTYGCVLNQAFPGRREVRDLTGNYQVPTLVLDDGTVIDGSENIVAWADEASAARQSRPRPHSRDSRVESDDAPRTRHSTSRRQNA